MTPQEGVLTPSSTQDAVKQEVADAAKTGLKHFVHALIAGLKAHPELLAELAEMVATKHVDTQELAKMGAQVAASGVASELQTLGE
jgi:hypothetical protein